MVEAIAQAAFVDDLERMSQGMDTLIGEKGVSVSGGQKQRISLARAFLRDAELLLLDDSLSAVDAKTEQAIIDTIQKERNGQDDHHCFSSLVCCSSGGLDHRFGSRADCRRRQG